MALFCKMDLKLLRQQLNGQRDKLELCIFFVAQIFEEAVADLIELMFIHVLSEKILIDY